jgi:glycosyltransferase involved in cell wall biosynthesis
MKTIAILIPCLNEEPTISKVISDFKGILPETSIIIYDNNSTDNSVKLAIDSGATVIKNYIVEGKGTL